MKFSGVTSKSIGRSVETTVTPSPSVVGEPKDDSLEKEVALEKNELESEEMVKESNEVDNSLNYDATASTLLADEEAAKEEETNEEMADSFDDYSNTRTVDNTAEGEIPADLAGHGINEDEIANAAEVMNLIAKRAAALIDKFGDPQLDSIDMDNFQFSDFPKIFAPLVQALSGSPESEAPEAPTEDDFFLWFPAMKKFLEFAMKESDAAKPTDVPKNSTTNPARRSGLATSTEPSRQIAPASMKPTESDDLPATLQDIFYTPELPTIAAPLLPDPLSLSDDSDYDYRRIG